MQQHEGPRGYLDPLTNELTIDIVDPSLLRSRRRLVPLKFKLAGLMVLIALLVVVLTHPWGGATAERAFGEPGPAKAPGSAPANPDTADKVKIGSAASGSVDVRGYGEVSYKLVQPILDNRQAFAKYFRVSEYSGDLGNHDHEFADRLEDHTPRSVDTYRGTKPRKGWIYAQDLGVSDKNTKYFDQVDFTKWFVSQLRDGKYKEVKWFISTRPELSGTNYWGDFYRSDGWKAEDRSPDHDTHVHISYMMSGPSGYDDIEHAHSTIIRDYACEHLHKKGC